MKASVVVFASTVDRGLDETLFSIACQPYRPLDVWVVSEQPDRRVDDYRRLSGDVSWQWSNQSPEHAALGTYVSFVEAGQILYPGHVSGLVQLLGTTGARWAIARTRWATVEGAGEGGVPFVTAKREMGWVPNLGPWNALQLPIGAALFDRERVDFPSPVPTWSQWTAAAFMLRLAFRFPPAAATGLATCELRVARFPPQLQMKTALKKHAPGLAEMLRSAGRIRLR